MLQSASQPQRADHVPVLADEVRELLAVQPGETVIDATFGAGGHARLLAGDLARQGPVHRDRPRSRRAKYFDQFQKGTPIQSRLLRGDFSVVLGQLAQNGVRADAILLDLGVSSMQIDRPDRGFSYAVDAPLDMRMDPSDAPLGRASSSTSDAERELADIFRKLRRGALRAPDRPRDRPPPRGAAVRAHARSRRGRARRHSGAAPLRRRPSRQARVPGAAHRRQRRARLARRARSPRPLAVLRPGGRIAVISFHSLEDRIVKRFLAAEARGCVCPPDFPVCACGKEPSAAPPRPARPCGRLPPRSPRNPRSASARLRAAEKTGEE